MQAYGYQPNPAMQDAGMLGSPDDGIFDWTLGGKTYSRLPRAVCRGPSDT